MTYWEELQNLQVKCRNKYGEVTYEEAMNYRFPFGKYRGMLLTDLYSYDRGYFSYMRQQILKDKVSTSLVTYNLKMNLLLCMQYILDQDQIEKWGEEYERRYITREFSKFSMGRA